MAPRKQPHEVFARFDQIRESFRESDDVWLRYAESTDVQRWADYLVVALPRLLERFILKTDGGHAGA